jgi:predicted DNA-binding transcriptional regulator YafY
MATNKNATIRYQTLNRCFRNPGRKYYIDDLIEACNDSLLDIDPSSTGIKRRQLLDDIKFMRDSQGFDAPIESLRDGKKAYYRYSDLSFSINNQPLNEKEAGQLKEALLTLSRFKGIPQFEWVDEIKTRLEASFQLKSREKVIEFEENPFLKGKEHIGILYDAIVNKQILEIQYHPFNKLEPIKIILNPYFLKQYNSRWFLFGRNEEFNTISNLPLDRIIEINETQMHFTDSDTWDFEEFFEDVVGVTVKQNIEPEKIILKISKQLWPYIESKPIHGSQKVKVKNDENVIIELTLQINYELTSVIFAFGEDVKVVAPEELKSIIKNKAEALLKNYL